ncbi:MAG: UDP-N-acetylmuramate dehydrogenase [Clostridia bacterium]|nr:UDP-N-acetylmuramate dehydrogenase [Clostridia bacterium]
MDLSILAGELQQKIKGKILINEPLKNHTTFRIGGPADLLVVPAEVEELPYLLEFGEEKGLPVTLLGNGSNVLVRDGGIPGLVIKLAGGPKQIQFDGTGVVADAGALMPRLAREAQNRGLTGLVFMIGIPGTVGGGVVMNAGAHGQCMEQVVTRVETIGPDRKMRLLPPMALQMGYRNSSLQGNFNYVTRVYFKLSMGEKDRIREQMEHNLEFRRQKQPWNRPSAGSVFINPPGQAAGFLLDRAGVKGLTRGGAQVAEEHANFIINKGEATARDVLALIEEMQRLVIKLFGVELKTEIQVLGEDLNRRG